MKFEDITLSEMKQSQNDKHSWICLYEVPKGNQVQREN